jgi:transcriptional regulator with XRE-family HTH domain
MNSPEISTILERQLLLQLGDRIKRLRKAQGVGTVEMAARAGITRNTLRAVEAGDPAPSIGTYLRVMSVLGVGGELALLAGDTLLPPPADSAAARSRRAAPVVQVRVSADEARHRLQDLQSLAQGARPHATCPATATGLAAGHRSSGRGTPAHPEAGE